MAEMVKSVPKILIVDDEPFQRRLMRETLAIHPTLSFMEATDGVQALDLVRANPPDLMLLDVQLPHMDGLAVCRTIKHDPTLKAIYITLVSALSKPEDIAKGREAGADDFLPKPFEEQALWNAVTKALHIEAR
jgi:CheY-like chemotaxis protein